MNPDLVPAIGSPNTLHSIDDDLLPKVPAVVVVDRREILCEALGKLNRPSPHEQIDDLGDGNFLCTLMLELPPHKSCTQVSAKRFSGFSTLSAADSVNKASDDALTYLESNGLITIDDFNSSAKRKLLCAKTFADLFEDKINVLQTNSERYKVLCEDIHAQIYDACAGASDCLSVRLNSTRSQIPDANRFAITYVGPVPPETALQKTGAMLASASAQLHDVLLAISKGT
ncbi:hypothetical protein EJB05_20334 [Eragrostis curvula]|uniref:Uncharacterized protein n=1 Tax=Eragrostis curvula TaxID=38414 RepID=A0A5J9UZS5_9POAL|nr:hypothetical protein EJB05_20334 [Eragrostis curvula]